MTVKELREALAGLPDDALVIVEAGDCDYSPLSTMWHGVYVPRTSWGGDGYIATLDAAAIRAGYRERDLYTGDDGQSALFLVSTN